MSGCEGEGHPNEQLATTSSRCGGEGKGQGRARMWGGGTHTARPSVDMECCDITPLETIPLLRCSGWVRVGQLWVGRGEGAQRSGGGLPPITRAYYTLPQCFRPLRTEPPCYLQQVAQARLRIQLQPALIWPCLLAATVPTVAAHGGESSVWGGVAKSTKHMHALKSSDCKLGPSARGKQS